MLFNSIQYLIFFPIVLGLYFLFAQKYRWIILLAASYFFYMCWKPEYIILIIISTLIDYVIALRMDAVVFKKQRKKYLIISIIMNLGLLFSFKYFNFFNNSLSVFLNKFNIQYYIPGLEVLLPVGISFYTFQTLSYTIDVYQGQRKAERHLGMFALYVSFFPQLVAGPIERSISLLPQFRAKFDFDKDRAVSGLKLIAKGMFKKVVIANYVALAVDRVYNSPQDFSGFSLWIATYCFAIQIYCDFSGYSDIAIGSAKIMGFSLMKNFNRPYISQSIFEFWKRWHISLSSWFKDYLYIPLGGNRLGISRTYINILIVFLISGMWHGANWTFLVWGGIHGFYLLVENYLHEFKHKWSFIFENIDNRIIRFIKIFVTFHLVCLGWIFFRAKTLSDAFYIVTNLFDFSGLNLHLQGVFSWLEFLILFVFCLILSFNSYVLGSESWLRFKNNNLVIYFFYSLIINITIFFWSYDRAFIYFQF